MEGLLCDEDWLSTSADTHGKNLSLVCVGAKEDEDEEQAAVSVCMAKEMSYMPDPHYKEFLETQDLVFVRLTCIQWLLKVEF